MVDGDIAAGAHGDHADSIDMDVQERVGLPEIFGHADDAASCRFPWKAFVCSGRKPIVGALKGAAISPLAKFMRGEPMNVRLKVLQSLLARSTVRYMLLEKVLFQRLGDYEVADALLKAHSVQAWVNCTRRAYPFYNSIREFFGNEPLRWFQVSGGNWGLGCNSIHFLDLLAKLTDGFPTELTTDALDRALIPSKRKNFMEFTGALRGKFDGTEFELASLADSTARLLMTIRSDKRTCVIDETGGQAFLFDGSSWEQRGFTMPLLSELATSVATSILREGVCDLPTYEQSAILHLPLLRALGAHAAIEMGTPVDHCPIT